MFVIRFLRSFVAIQKKLNNLGSKIIMLEEAAFQILHIFHFSLRCPPPHIEAVSSRRTPQTLDAMVTESY